MSSQPYRPGDVVNGHVLVSLPTGLQWIPLPRSGPIPVDMSNTAEDNVSRFLNIGRSRTFVFKGDPKAQAMEDWKDGKIVFPPQPDEPKRKRRWWVNR